MGLERTGGFRTVAFCEIDPFCRRVLAKHWPNVRCFEDVTKLRGEDVGPVDVICGGFPCQDISSAGLMAGITGESSGLWKEFARLIGELRPSIVIVENVADLSHRGLGDVAGDLARLGYCIEWFRLSAANLGAPHHRARIWIVAHPEKVSWVYEPNNWDAIRSWLLNDLPAWPASPWNETAAAVCRVDDGIPDRVDRTGALGNAVVPQIVELIGRAILSASQLKADAA